MVVKVLNKRHIKEGKAREVFTSSTNSVLS
jgi:hypothetical protein